MTQNKEYSRALKTIQQFRSKGVKCVHVVRPIRIGAS